MKIEIDIDRYLSDEEMREISRDVFRDAVKKEMTDEAAIKRQLSNCAYELVYERVDEVCGGNTKEILAQEVAKIIGDLSSYNVFKKPDAWDREPNSAYVYLQSCIKDNLGKIDTIIAEQISPQTVLMLKDCLPEYINDAIMSAIRES